jgi:hypothetical protein
MNGLRDRRLACRRHQVGVLITFGAKARGALTAVALSQRGGRNPARVTDTSRWTAAFERWPPAPARA